MMMRSEKYLKSCIDEYVSLIDKHRALMEILLFHAQGSSLERFRENYTDRSTEVVKAWFASMQRKHPEINTAVSDFIIHLHTVWTDNQPRQDGWQGGNLHGGFLLFL